MTKDFLILVPSRERLQTLALRLLTPRRNALRMSDD
jgi:hypothetical protein